VLLSLYWFVREATRLASPVPVPLLDPDFRIGEG
jgi:hypothetical protein